MVMKDHAFIPYKGLNFSEEKALQQSADFYEFFDKRRSVRHFSDKPVPREIIEKIIPILNLESFN